MTRPDAPRKAPFHWDDPLLLSAQLSDDERMVRDAANAYCQDNEISWMDWQLPESPDGTQLVAYVQQLARIRARFVTLQSHRFPDGEHEVAEGLHEVEWFDEQGQPLTPGDWENPEGVPISATLARCRAKMPQATTPGH